MRRLLVGLWVVLAIAYASAADEACENGLKGDSIEARRAAARICGVEPVQTVSITSRTAKDTLLLVPVAEVSLANKDVNALLDDEGALKTLAGMIFDAFAAGMPDSPKGYAAAIYLVAERRPTFILRRTPENGIERYQDPVGSGLSWFMKIETDKGKWKAL